MVERNILNVFPCYSFLLKPMYISDLRSGLLNFSTTLLVCIIYLLFDFS